MRDTHTHAARLRQGWTTTNRGRGARAKILAAYRRNLPTFQYPVTIEEALGHCRQWTEHLKEENCLTSTRFSVHLTRQTGNKPDNPLDLTLGGSVDRLRNVLKDKKLAAALGRQRWSVRLGFRVLAGVWGVTKRHSPDLAVDALRQQFYRSRRRSRVLVRGQPVPLGP